MFIYDEAKSTSMTTLHDNADVDDISVDIDSSVGAIAPQFIRSDRLSFIPIHKADLQDVRSLFQRTTAESLRYYSEQSYSLPGDIHQFVSEKQTQWENGDKFEYVIEYKKELVGKTYFSLEADMTESTIGLWLQQRVWGNELSQERADVMLYILFEMIGVSIVSVGCVAKNTQSFRSIEKYVSRYGGSFCGITPTVKNRFHDTEDIHTTIPHLEFAITKSQFDTTESGISTPIPGVEYDVLRNQLIDM